MKMMWKKNNKAVSPVIATILMVAITVVLAAVLYVMVMGFGGDSGGQTPTASLTNSGNRLVLSISESYKIESGSSVSFNIAGTNVLLSALTKGTAAGFTNYYNGSSGISFVDAGSDGKVSTGDYFVKTGTTAVVIGIVWSSGGTNQIIAEGTI